MSNDAALSAGRLTVRHMSVSGGFCESMLIGEEFCRKKTSWKLMRTMAKAMLPAAIWRYIYEFITSQLNLLNCNVSAGSSILQQMWAAKRANRRRAQVTVHS